MRLLGRDRQPARARPHRGEPAGRRDLAVHDPRLGRQDPDGLLLAVGDGLPRRAEGQVRHRDRQRRRLRPARHRHAGRRADEPQPLPRGRDPVPLRRRPTRLAGRRADRQDPGVELDDRPGRRGARQADGRGAGRVQVVRAGADRRLVRVRRRGVGGRVVPPHGRHDVDHRQGRADPGACSPRRSWPGPGSRRASTTPTWSPQHGDPAYARIDAPATREQKAKLAALSPDDVTATELAGEAITASSPRPPATTPRSAASRSPPSPPGSRPAPPAPRTSTRSTPSRSRAPSTSPRCRRRPRRSWTRRCRASPQGPQRWSGTISASGSARGGIASRATLTSATRAWRSTLRLSPFTAPSRSSTAAGDLGVGERRPGADRHLDVRQRHQDRQHLVAEAVEQLEPLVAAQRGPRLVDGPLLLAHRLVLHRQHALRRALEGDGQLPLGEPHGTTLPNADEYRPTAGSTWA